MLGEDYEEEFESNKKDLFKLKSNSNLSHNNNNTNDYLEYSVGRSRDGKKERTKKRKKKSSCENCKALSQKINELEQLNEELLKIKEKLSQTNEELTLKNEEIVQNNIIIINKNKELININKQLKEENEELINKNNELMEEKTGYKTEISGLKKQLITKVNELSSISKEKEIITNQNNNKDNSDKQFNKNNILNVDILSLNSDSIPPKKEEIINSVKKIDTNINNYNINDTKYCTIDDYNELKSIVEELKEKVNNLEKWKKNFGDREKTKKKSKEKKIINDNDKKENSIKHFDKNDINKKIKDNTDDDKLSKSLTIEQKIKNNFATETSSSNNTSSFNFNYENNNNNINNITNNIKKEIITPRINKSFNKKEKENNKKNKELEKTKNKNQKFNSKIIINVEDLDLIARGLVKDDIDSLKNLRVGYKLIYRATEHGGEAEDFHERCDEIEGTLIIIKTKEGNIFGGYTSLSWDPEDEAEKKDEDAFVFSLNLEKLYFESGKKEYSIFCDKNKGPCFVGMFAVQEYIFNTKSYINPWGIQCFSGENYEYEINQGKNEFYIEELEVFQVIVKKS